MKRILALTLALALAVFSLAGCSSSKEESSTESSTAETSTAAESSTAAGESSTSAAAGDSDIKIAMITDYGDITDQSFNQTTYEACKAFAESNGFDFTYYKPEGDSTPERVAMVDKAVSDGYNVVVMPGYAFAETITETADTYPDVKFIALDVSQYDLDKSSGEDGYSRDNVYCAVYQEELPGYMAGYYAVASGYTKLGFLGGMAVPAVQRYGYGFVQGADAAAKDLSVSGVEINYAYGNQFYGDNDITAAMATWYNGGTEVVFACGGGIYSSAAEAAAKVNGKVIGVDVDQKAIIDGTYGDGMTITSAMKGLAATVNTLLAAVKDGKWDDYKGQVQTLGLVSGTDMSENYVGLPEDSTVWTDSFTKEDYEALVGKIFDGTITVSNDTSADEPAAENVTVNFQGNLK